MKSRFLLGGALSGEHRLPVVFRSVAEKCSALTDWQNRAWHAQKRRRPERLLRCRGRRSRLQPITISYGRGCGVGRALGVGPVLGVGVGLAVAVGVGVGVTAGVVVAVGVTVAVAVGVVVAVGVGVGLAVGVGVGVAVGPCTSNEPLSSRPSTTRGNPGPRWSFEGGGANIGSPASMAGLSGNSSCVSVGPPLSCSEPNSGSVLI